MCFQSFVLSIYVILYHVKCSLSFLFLAGMIGTWCGLMLLYKQHKTTINIGIWELIEELTNTLN